MHLRPSGVWVCLILVAVFAVHHAQGSFWDAVPVISQLKSALQACTGHEDSAKETQDNFVHTAPLVSQLKSASQSAKGDKEGAQETQKRFLHEFTEPLVENTPIVGHAVGAGHLIADDKEEGERAMKAATSSTAVVVGGLAGGPIGAVAGGAAMDFLITGIDSAKHHEYKAYGVKKFLDDAAHGRASVGDVFDFVTLIGLQILVGKVAMVVANKARAHFKHRS